MEIKCQLDATEVFIADLIACSTCFGLHHARHQELKSIIQWLLPVAFKLLVWCGAEGYVSGLQDVGRITKLLYNSPSISALTQHIMKTMIPKSGLDEIRNKVAMPLILRCTRNSTNCKSHYLPLGLSLPPAVPITKIA